MIRQTADEGYVWQRHILRLEAQGMVTRTFRRLDPERQLAVIEALLAEAAEHGPDGVNVKRVAARSGVGVGSLYQYFPGRAGMLEFAARAAGAVLAETLASYREAISTMSLREGLRAFVSGSLEWSRSHPDLLSFFVRAAYAGVPGFADTLVRPVARSLRSMVRALLEAANERGEIRPGVDLESATSLIYALLVCVVDVEVVPHLNEYFLLLDGRSPRRLREAAIDFAIGAIAADERPTRRRRS
jgi:AcrR family transcriptional regulator